MYFEQFYASDFENFDFDLPISKRKVRFNFKNIGKYKGKDSNKQQNKTSLGPYQSSS